MKSRNNRKRSRIVLYQEFRICSVLFFVRKQNIRNIFHGRTGKAGSSGFFRRCQRRQPGLLAGGIPTEFRKALQPEPVLPACPFLCFTGGRSRERRKEIREKRRAEKPFPSFRSFRRTAVMTREKQNNPFFMTQGEVGKRAVSGSWRNSPIPHRRKLFFWDLCRFRIQSLPCAPGWFRSRRAPGR